jgi:hypothetical protein
MATLSSSNQAVVTTTTTALTSAITGNLDFADWIASLYWAGVEHNEANQDMAQQIYDDVLAGNFTLGNLFVAAQTKSLTEAQSTTDLSGSPDPTLTVGGQTFNIGEALTGNHVDYFIAKSGKIVTYHEREYFTQVGDVPQIDSDWDTWSPGTTLDVVGPEFTSLETANVDENIGATQVVYDADAIDPAGDGGPSNPVTYSLGTVGGDEGSFTIDLDSGEVTLTGDPDYEIKSSYSFEVVATDATGNPTTQTVTLAINDVNEKPTLMVPSFEGNIIFDDIFLVGGGAPGTNDLVGTTGVQDIFVIDATHLHELDVPGFPDGFGQQWITNFSGLNGDGDIVAFINAPATWDMEFSSGGNTSIDFANSSPPNFFQYIVNVTASGVLTTVSLNSIVTLPSGALVDVVTGGAAPVFAEDTAVGMVLADVHGTDPDTLADLDVPTTNDTFNDLTYSIEDGDPDGLFAIDSDGRITLAAGKALDFETASQHLLTVRVTDGGGLSDEKTVTINVANVDEVAPEITSAATANVDENIGTDQVVYTATADDTADISAGITFSLKDGSDSALSIDPITGAVTLSDNPDYETKSSYIFTVVADDGVTTPSELEVTLSINDINDAPVAANDVWVLSNDAVAAGIITALWFTHNDSDQDDDPLFITAVGGLAGSGLTANFDPVSGYLIDITGLAVAGSYNITYTLSDGTLVDNNNTVALQVVTTAGGTNDTPSLDGNDFSYINGENGADVITGDSALSGNAGIDNFVGGGGGDTLSGGDGNDTLAGDADNDTLNGDAGNDILTGGAGNDSLNGGIGNDILTGGTGTDTLNGGLDFDKFVFAAGDTPRPGGPPPVFTDAGEDTIGDYLKGAVGTGDLIDYSAALTVGGSANSATATEASIDQITGIATFFSGSGTTFADALADIATRFTVATNTAGEFAFFQVGGTGNFHLFISDGTAGVSANDVIVELAGVTTIGSIDVGLGDLTILS